MHLRDQAFADRVADEVYDKYEALEAARERYGFSHMTREEYRNLARVFFGVAADRIENSATYNYIMLNTAACEDAVRKDEDVDS